MPGATRPDHASGSGRPAQSRPRMSFENRQPSQHLEIEELRWREADVDRLTKLRDYRCIHPAGPRPAGANIDSGSGRGSLVACRARRPDWLPARQRSRGRRAGSEGNAPRPRREARSGSWALRVARCGLLAPLIVRASKVHDLHRFVMRNRLTSGNI
jgi:hypothetical protein